MSLDTGITWLLVIVGLTLSENETAGTSEQNFSNDLIDFDFYLAPFSGLS